MGRGEGGLCGGNGENVKYGRRVDLLGPEVGNKFVEMDEFMKEYSDLSSGAWGKPEETKPMMLWLRKDPEYLVFRAEVEIDLPLETIAEFMLDDQFIGRTDPRSKNLKKLKELSSQCDIVQFSMEAKWPVSARDMVVYINKYYSDKDTFNILNFKAFDTEHPPSKDIMRIDIKIQGRTLTRISSNKTKIVNTSMMNPKMSGVPIFVLRGKLKDGAIATHQFMLAVEVEAKKLSK